MARVDDSIVSSLSGKLFYSGFVFETTTTGEQALEKAGTTKFQTAVLDVDLPDMDGIEVARKLREKTIRSS